MTDETIRAMAEEFLIQRDGDNPYGYTHYTRLDVRCSLEAFAQAILARQGESRSGLLQQGAFTLHSGERSQWKIQCDALTESDIQTVALMLVERLPPFGSVEGVPTGGLRLTAALSGYVTAGPLLIVDDVATTGDSLEKQRNGRPAIGAVIFARGVWPTWVTPLFRIIKQRQTVRAHSHETLVQLDAALAKAWTYAVHTTYCAMRSGYGDPCTCGLAGALAEAGWRHDG